MTIPQIPPITTIPSGYTTPQQIQGALAAIAFNNANAQGATQFTAFLKTAYNKFWDSNQTAAQLQAQIDTLASNVFSDGNGGATNAFLVITAEEKAAITFVKTYFPQLFADQISDPSGTICPTTGAPAVLYQDPAWTFTLDNTKPSGIAVIAPINWNP